MHVFLKNCKYFTLQIKFLLILLELYRESEQSVSACEYREIE